VLRIDFCAMLKAFMCGASNFAGYKEWVAVLLMRFLMGFKQKLKLQIYQLSGVTDFHL
jgi:hypothetical protein